MNENTNSRESGGGSVPSPGLSQNSFFGEELPDAPESGPLQDFGQLDIPATPVIPANMPLASCLASSSIGPLMSISQVSLHVCSVVIRRFDQVTTRT